MTSIPEFVKGPVLLSSRFLKFLLKSPRDAGGCGTQLQAPGNVLPPLLLKEINSIHSRKHPSGEKVMLQ